MELFRASHLVRVSAQGRVLKSHPNLSEEFAGLSKGS